MREVSAETRARMSIAQRRRYSDPVERARTGDAVKHAYEDPTVRARMGASHRGLKRSLETRTKMGVIRRKKWEDPAFGDMMRAAGFSAGGSTSCPSGCDCGRHRPDSPEHKAAISRAQLRSYEQGTRKNRGWRDPTSLEQAMALLLQDAGLEFEAQVRFGRYVVDAWVPSHGLVFEADGMFWYHHQDKEREAWRDEYLIQRGVVAIVHLDDDDLRPYTI